MKAGYLNKLISSFYLWLDNAVVSKGNAFTNYTGNLYKTEDPKYGNTSTIYGSSYKQFLYDDQIIGATVPSGIYSNGNFIPKGVSGMAIDHLNGRVIFYNNQVNLVNPTLSSSVKEFNIYYTDEKEEVLLFEKTQPVMQDIRNSGIALKYNDLPYPCIFIQTTVSENTPFAFGGQDKTSTTIRCVILAANSFQCDSLISLMNDTNKQNFPVLAPDQLPFNHLNDFKNTNFNYKHIADNAPLNTMAYIENVIVTKLGENANAKINKKTSAASVDFEISSLRYPRF